MVCLTFQMYKSIKHAHYILTKPVMWLKMHHLQQWLNVTHSWITSKPTWACTCHLMVLDLLKSLLFTCVMQEHLPPFPCQGIGDKHVSLHTSSGFSYSCRSFSQSLETSNRSSANVKEKKPAQSSMSSTSHPHEQPPFLNAIAGPVDPPNSPDML